MVAFNVKVKVTEHVVKYTLRSHLKNDVPETK